MDSESEQGNVIHIDLNEYLTADQAGKVANLTGRRIRQLCTSGEIQGQNIAGRWLVNRASLYSWLAKRGK